MIRICCCLAAFLAASGRSPAEPLAAGEWLVDLGRDYPLSPQSGLSNADARITLLFMEAATRVQPELAEGIYWQADLLTALERPADALEAMAGYLRLRPEDGAVWLRWIELSIQVLQSAEDRASFFRELLTRHTSLPEEVTSDLHRRLADFHYNRSERDQAAREAQAALQAYRYNFAARALLETVQQTELTPQRRLEWALAGVLMDPTDPSRIWRVGDLLASWGLTADADRWYDLSIRIYEVLPGRGVPPDLLTARAEVLLAQKRFDEARELARKAVELDGRTVQAHRVLARLAQQLDRPDEARKHQDAAAEVLTSILAQSDEPLPPEAAAQIAWFFASEANAPKDAERLARQALTEAPKLALARRALGAALRHLNRPEEAREALTPIVDEDPWAALELVRLLHAAGHKQIAADRLRSLAARPTNQDLRNELARLATEWQVSAPATQPAVPEQVTAMLKAFPEAVLDYPFHPEKYLALSWSMPAQELPAGEPWRCSVRLENTGPFPITLGEDGALIPELLCSVSTTGDQSRSSGPVLHLVLTGRLRLMPGESVALTQTLDVGPIRASMIGTPQITHQVEVEGVLSPIRLLLDDGREAWLPQVGGLKPKPLRFRRVGVVATPEKIRELIGQSQSADVSGRIAATELLAMLLAESQHLTAGRLRYSARRIDPAPVQTAVLARVSDPDWQVRVRLAETMRWFILDASATQAATRLLSDPHWLVRGLALRMLADQHSDRFRPVLERAASSDADEWVRRMASSLAERLGPTTRPE
ncbi:MAG: hypothetical protein AMXMBFR13_39520 [Phycisphaerae bacterium]